MKQERTDSGMLRCCRFRSTRSGVQVLPFSIIIYTCWQLIGASTLISRVLPMYRRFEKTVIPDIRMQRVVRLSDSDATAFVGLGALLDAAVIKREGMVATSFDVALLNYNRSHETGDDFERVIDLATSLEAILTDSETETEAVGHRLRTRAAALLWTNEDPGSDIYRDVSALYGLRSKLVHGARIKQSDLRKLIYSISTVSEDAPFGVAMAFAVDRLRDLVRRSFLARLCLASGDEPLWPFEGGTPVDAALSDDEQRGVWRERWRVSLASITGSDRAADAAEPAADPLRAHQAIRERSAGAAQERAGTGSRGVTGSERSNRSSISTSRSGSGRLGYEAVGHQNLDRCPELAVFDASGHDRVPVNLYGTRADSVRRRCPSSRTRPSDVSAVLHYPTVVPRS